MRTPTANDDSYWIKIDNGSWLAWNNIATSTVWNWNFFQSFNLAAGSHTLYVAYREDGTDMDKIYIGTGFPTDYGEDAPTCTITARLSSGQGVDSLAGIKTIQLYPNPAHSSLSLQLPLVWKPGSVVVIFDTNGRTVYSRTTKSNLEVFDLSHLQSGVYFVKVYDREQHFSGKFIKN
jgi:Secretion system C-terminal sorting domain